MRTLVRIPALVLWLCTAALFGVFLLLFWFTANHGAEDLDPLIGVAMFGMATVGALVAVRKPAQPLGWLLLVIGFSAMLSGTAYLAATRILGALPAQELVAAALLWLAQWAWVLALGLLVTLLLLLYPTGRLLTPRWRVIAGLEGAWLALFLTAVMFGPGLPDIPNPFAFLMIPPAAIDAVGGPGLIAILLVNIAGLVLRYRRGDVGERQQIKWFLLPIAVVVVGTVIQLFAPWLGVEKAPLYEPLIDLVFGIGYLLFPVAMGIAILRHRLFDIDLIIRRTVQYTVVTVLLALLFFGSVIILQRLFEGATGQQSQLAIVLSTLAIAALFNPLHNRIQAGIDRRFFRKKYDAQQVLARFAISARDETDLDALLVELVRVVQETLQPEHVSIWLKKQ
jgi:hypothetical protein